MPDDVREQAERELDRLERVGEGGGGEGQMIRTYLDWLVSVPWSERTDEVLDPVKAREILDADHAGLEDVKDRIVEYIAVRKLRTSAASRPTSGRRDPDAHRPARHRQDVDRRVDRPRDRARVRPHVAGRRARRGRDPRPPAHVHRRAAGPPGRALRDAGTMNPVIMLDEVDKVGADWRGDPSSALLEVLDPAQNDSFRDHYLDVELDLSEVMFIATANMAETIPGPLLDRMEVIHFDGYTVEEKTAIARDYLLKRQRERNGLREDEVTVTDEVLRTLVSEYTREAGVRNLERELGTVLRKVATNVASRRSSRRWSSPSRPCATRSGRQSFFQEAAVRTAVPGVATGLAFTPVGGDVLFIEANAMKGSNGLTLTGQLGDVMKESARIALTYVAAHADELGIDEEAFEEREFHVHVPAGAIPRTAPSAGVTMTTALASLLTGRPVKHTVGMTGEVTLQGRVLPIGGLKQKVLAAHAAGLTDVIIPERNRADLDDVPAEVREQMTFHPVMTVGEVLDTALEPAPSGRSSSTRRRRPGPPTRGLGTPAGAAHFGAPAGGAGAARPAPLDASLSVLMPVFNEREDRAEGDRPDARGRHGRQPTSSSSSSDVGSTDGSRDPARRRLAGGRPDPLPRPQPRQGVAARVAPRCTTRRGDYARDHGRRRRVRARRDRQAPAPARPRRGRRGVRRARLRVAHVLQLLVRDGQQVRDALRERHLQQVRLGHHDLPQGHPDRDVPRAAPARAGLRDRARDHRAAHAPRSPHLRDPRRLQGADPRGRQEAHGVDGLRVIRTLLRCRFDRG
jgi:hypothetical protein